MINTENTTYVAELKAQVGTVELDLFDLDAIAEAIEWMRRSFRESHDLYTPTYLKIRTLQLELQEKRMSEAVRRELQQENAA